MLIAKFDVCTNTEQLVTLRAMQNSTNGGSSDTEVKELAVNP